MGYTSRIAIRPAPGVVPVPNAHGLVPEPWSETEKRLVTIHKIYSDDLRFADTKATALLTLSCALAAGAFAAAQVFIKNGGDVSGWAKGSLVTGYIVAAITIGVALCAMFPRLRPGHKDSKDSKPSADLNPPKNDDRQLHIFRLLHSYHVGSSLRNVSQYGDLKAMLRQLKSDGDIENMFADEMERMARIAAIKFRLVQLAVISIGVEIGLFIAFLAVMSCTPPAPSSKIEFVFRHLMF